MAISIRSALASTGSTNLDDGTFTVTTPASIENGDLLVIIIGKRDDPDITPPAGSGFTSANEQGTTTGNDIFGAVYYKRVTDGASEESRGYTFDSAGVSEPFNAYAMALIDVSSSNIEDVAFTGAGAFATLPNDTSPNCPSVTTVTDGAFALAVWITNVDDTVTMPGGSWNTEYNGATLRIASQTFATGGTGTGTPEITDVATGQETMVGTFVFRPGGATASASASPSISRSASVSPSISQSASVSESPSVSPSTGESSSVSPSVSPSISPSASVSPSVSPSASVSPSVSGSASVSPSVTPRVSPSVRPSV